jgi:hypothetical protein
MQEDPNWPDMPCYFHKSRPCSCDRTFRALSRFAYANWLEDDCGQSMTPAQRAWCIREYRNAGTLVDPISDEQMERAFDRFLAGAAIIAMIEREWAGENA